MIDQGERMKIRERLTKGLARIQARLRQQPGALGNRLGWVGGWGVFGGDRESTALYTPEDALRLSASWRCVKVISGSLASLPWYVVRTSSMGEQTREDGHPLSRLLSDSPNTEMTATVFREAMIVNALLWGNAYAEIVRDGTGRPVALWPIDPSRVTPERSDEGGMLRYKVSQPSGGDVTIMPRGMFHVPSTSSDGVCGYGILDVAYGRFRGMRRVDAWTGAYFRNAMQPPGVIEMPEGVEVTRQTLDNIWDSFSASMGADRGGAHMPFVAGQGMKYSAIAHTPEQAQMIETRQFLVREVCRWYGVPPYLVYAEGDPARANTEAQAREFRTFTLAPFIAKLEQEANRKLVLYPRTYRTRIDTMEMTRGDTAARVQYYRELRNMGVASVNEIRRAEGMDTIGPEGDHRVMQVQWQPIDPMTGAPGAPGSMMDDDDDAGESGDSGESGGAGEADSGGSPGMSNGAQARYTNGAQP